MILRVLPTRVRRGPLFDSASDVFVKTRAEKALRNRRPPEGRQTLSTTSRAWTSRRALWRARARGIVFAATG